MAKKLSPAGAALLEKMRSGLSLEDRRGPALVGKDGFCVERPKSGVVGKLVTDGVLLVHRSEGAPTVWTIAP